MCLSVRICVNKKINKQEKTGMWQRNRIEKERKDHIID